MNAANAHLKINQNGNQRQSHTGTKATWTEIKVHYLDIVVICIILQWLFADDDDENE